MTYDTKEVQSEHDYAAAMIDAQAAATNPYTDEYGATLEVMPVHYNGKHYLRYFGVIDGKYVNISGPHSPEGDYYAHCEWPEGKELLRSLGVYDLSNTSKTLKAATEWVHNAAELAEAAVNRHINRGRTEAAVHKLEREQKAAVDEINRQYEEMIDAVYKEAGLNPDPDQ